MQQKSFRLFRLFASAIFMGTALTSAQQYSALFNGQNLSGWTVLGKGSWKVQNGEIVGTQAASEPDFTHLIHDTTVADFELTFQFKNPKGNSGVFFRMEQTTATPAGVSGVQAVIDATKNDDTMFGFYETNGRNDWLKKWSYSTSKSIFKAADWNSLTVVAEGTRLLLKLNTQTIVDYVDATGRKQGKIAFKLHGGRDGEAHFKDVQIRPVGTITGLANTPVEIEKSLQFHGRRFSVALKGNYRIRVIDTRGRLLWESTHVGASEHDLSSLTRAGIAFLQIRFGSATVTKRITLL
jgi:hypothetical protein